MTVNTNPRPFSSSWRRYLDIISITLTVYSIGCLLVELELETDSLRSTGWWYWNELVVALVFSAEYLIRWITATDRRHYPLTFLAVIDLLAVMPFYIGLLADPGQLAGLRVLRMVRMFRLFRHTESLALFLRAFSRCRAELGAVITVVLLVILVNSLAVFYFEHPVQPDKFAKPSDAMWWCVVTMSTVGYGDLTPITKLGRLVGVVTVVVGVASYGVFLTLFGGAWIDVLRERRDKHALHSVAETTATDAQE
ncbi:MAG: ion transporter [Gemmataceae bacterium]|nr:ion transporter [Gemmata sp.]MDW8198239.1 ion transporter [Gemmataceae bacterium]